MDTPFRKITALIAIVFCSFGGLLRAADDAAPSVEPGPALAKLKAGNARFADATASASKPTRARRAETAQGQHPFAIIVGCSDSRIPPEIIFDQNIGDLFVVRSAGNIVDDYALGSIEYAVEHLGVRLIVVVGHQHCGAVQAAVASGSAPGHIGEIVSAIRPAVETARGQSGDVLVNATKNNIDRVTAKIREESELGALKASVQVVEAYYDLESGKIEWLNR